MDARLAANRRNWNERTPIHVASRFYDVAGFEGGRITLSDVEQREVGPVAGRSLLHLQCHFGLDTLSWARLGATVTGVDFAGAAVREARALSKRTGLDARFLEANVYDLPALLSEQFDIVYTAVGVLCWLPDLAAWAKVAARFVKPGGAFYLMDTHPLLGVFEAAEEAPTGSPIENLRVRYPYFSGQEPGFHSQEPSSAPSQEPSPEALYFPGGVPSYAGDAVVESGCYEWPHSLGEILGALSDAGLVLEFFHEFDANRYQAFPGMVPVGDGWWRFPEEPAAGGQAVLSLPQLFSLRARKPA